MSVAATPAVEQPKEFSFSEGNLALARRIIAKYPTGKQASAVLPLLDLAQRQHDNWLPRAAMDYVARLLGMPPVKVYEVANFYTMFNRAPVGKHHVQICTTAPCWLRGSDEVVAACERKLGINLGETTADGQFTVVEVECLGACVNAPVVQIGDDYYEDVTGARMEELLDGLARGERPPVGSQVGRRNSCPSAGLTSLTAVPKKAAADPEPAPVPEVAAAPEALPVAPVPAPAAVSVTVAGGSGFALAPAASASAPGAEEGTGTAAANPDGPPRAMSTIES